MMQPPFSIIVPRGYLTWFQQGQPQTAEFAFDTEVKIDFVQNDSWYGATQVKGFPPGRAVLFYAADIGKRLRLMTRESVNEVHAVLRQLSEGKEEAKESQPGPFSLDDLERLFPNVPVDYVRFLLKEKKIEIHGADEINESCATYHLGISTENTHRMKGVASVGFFESSSPDLEFSGTVEQLAVFLKERGLFVIEIDPILEIAIGDKLRNSGLEITS